jgi:hypothetical protein
MRARARRSSASPPLALALSSLLALGLGCGQETSESASPKSGSELEIVDISGRYDLKGVTSAPGTDDEREIAGSMILTQEGEAYSASYEFKTLFPGENRPVVSNKIVVVQGRLDGRKIYGLASTQVVVSTVPGVDPGFAFIPRSVTTRIVSESVGLLSPDGSITVDIVNRAAPGEIYLSTRSRMSGKRVETVAPAEAD